MKSARGEEERHEQTVRHAAYARYDIAADLVWQTGERGTKEQGSHRSMQVERSRRRHREEQPAQHQPERQVRHAQDASQSDDSGRQDSIRDHVGDDAETAHLPEEGQERHRIQGAALLVEHEADQRQAEQLEDQDGRQNPDADGAAESAFVRQHLGDDGQAGQRQDRSERERCAGVQVQPEVKYSVRSYKEGQQYRSNNRNQCKQE